VNATGPIAGDELVLGVDGGGTKTTAWLARRGDHRDSPPIGRGQAGPGNPRAAGFATAQQNIAAAIATAFADAGLMPQPVHAACCGLSGAGRADEQESIQNWALEQCIAPAVRVTHDAEIILAASAGDPVGIALICGTGSLAWGRNSAGETARSGGWGYLLGDEGSAYAIALAGLRAAVRAADGRTPQTTLLPMFLERLGVSSPPELIGRIYGSEMSRERLAELAPIVFEAGAAGDATATRALEAAANDLSEMVLALVRRLRFGHQAYQLALAGGVLMQQRRLRHKLEAALQHVGFAPGSIALVEEPVRGAVALARAIG
jgi:N-acetylglucosamine kinase-like BadF-type ATPase